MLRIFDHIVQGFKSMPTKISAVLFSTVAQMFSLGPPLLLLLLL